MEPQLLSDDVDGNTTRVEVSEYNGRLYCHIRKFYHVKRTKNGVALACDETKMLTKACEKFKTFPAPKTVWKLSEDASIKFGKVVVFLKRDRKLFSNRKQFRDLRQILPKVLSVMKEGKTTMFCPQCSCDNCGPVNGYPPTTDDAGGASTGADLQQEQEDQEDTSFDFEDAEKE